jgi:hypothetical protein
VKIMSLQSGKPVAAVVLGLCLLTLFVARGVAQTPRETQATKISQAENSNKTVSRFLRSLPVSYKSDTVYVFLIEPMRMPRVEGAINAFVHHLRKASVKSDVITLAVSSRKRAAEKYLHRRAFASDYNLVLDKEFLGSFVFNQGHFGAPFAAKFSVKTGQLLSSYSLAGTTDSAAVAWFIADDSKPTAKRPASERQQRTQVRTDGFQLRCERKQRLLGSEDYPLSTTYYPSVSPSGNRLSFNDKLTHFIYIFDLNTGKLSNVLFPDSSEERMFCSGMPEHVYRFMSQSNMTLYLGNWFLDDTTLLISASLPKVEPVIWEGDSDYAFHNMPNFIKKGVFDNGLLGCDSIQSLPDSIPLGVAHSRASFVAEGGLVFLTYSRGWPKGNQTLTGKVPLEENPFTDEFYKHHLYLFAAYRPSGEFVSMWGRLSDRRQKLRIGYRWNEVGVVRFRDGRYYLSDGCSGEIYAYNQNASLVDSIKLFDDPPLIFPDVDRSREPELYLSEALKLNFRAVVKDFLVTRDYCHALLLWDESQPIVYKVGLKDHTTKKYALPARYEGKKAKHYLLRETPSGVSTVSLLESGDETWYCEFKLP